MGQGRNDKGNKRWGQRLNAQRRAKSLGEVDVFYLITPDPTVEEAEAGQANPSSEKGDPLADSWAS